MNACRTVSFRLGLPYQFAYIYIDAASVQKDFVMSTVYFVISTVSFVISTASFIGFAEISCAGFNFAIALLDLRENDKMQKMR